MKIINQTKIAILLATYNAEKYLSQQIDSIIKQSCEEWTLFIQDDGSSDHTMDIINNYVRDYPNKIMHVDLGLTRQGCCGNFMSLLNAVESQYYMFCDQDDVWLPEKISISLQSMQKNEQVYRSNMPLVIFTDRYSVDEKLVKIENAPNWNRHHRSDKLVRFVVSKLTEFPMLCIVNMCAGNTMLFNAAAKNASFPYCNIRVHDSNVAMAVSQSGGVLIPVFTPTILYRVHDNQLCGIRRKPLWSKALSLRRVLRSNINMYHIYAIYSKNGFMSFLYHRFKFFLLLRLIE